MRIMICYQNEFGGTDLLLSRLEDWCYRHNIQVFRNDKNIKNMEFDLVVLPMGSLYNLVNLRQKGIKFKKILIWVMGACYISSYLNISKLDSRNFFVKSISNILLIHAKRSLKYFYEKNSVIFTDIPSARIDLKYIKVFRNINFKNLIYPVAIDEYKGENYRVNNSFIYKKTMTVGWLGRVSRDFKVYSLIKVIEDFKKYIDESKSIIKIKFFIIGDGDGLEETEEYLRVNNIDYYIKKHVDYSDIPRTLNENIDLLFAMGTSALDGAKIGCPTIVVRPMETKDQFSNIYSWFYDMEGYSLGTLSDDYQYRTFKEISNEFYSLENHSRRCREESKKFISESIFERMFSRERISLINNIGVIGWLILLQAHFIKTARNKISKINKWLVS